MEFNKPAAQAGGGQALRGLAVRQIVPMGLLLALGWVLLQEFQSIDSVSVLEAVAQIGPGQWIAAGLASLGSFLAFGRFEAIMHRLLRTQVTDQDARIGGIAAIATAQMTGFGLLVATLARWRMFPDLTVGQALRLTAAASLSFMLCLGVLLAAALALAPLLDPAWRMLSGAIALAMLGGAVATLWRPAWAFRLPIPPLRAQASLLAWTAADTLPAAAALYVLLPPDMQPPMLIFAAVFLMALGAGLLGATPGGVGPFELMFLSCLPSLPEADIIAAILGFRLVYYALPGLVALGLLLAAPMLRHRSRPRPTISPVMAANVPPVKALVLSYNASRAEAGLMRQGAFDILCDEHARPLSLVAETGQSLIMLSDPLRRDADPAPTLQALETAAHGRMRAPCLYKCSARTAVVARRMGWQAIPVAQEAWLRPAVFDPGTASRRQLRRALRKAEKAGVEVRERSGTALPLAQMRRVAESWAAARHGGARGFSMGRFCASYVSGQLAYLAYLDDRLIGFITLHLAHGERTLDLVCHLPDIPPGTMHLLVTRAIEAAAAEGCARLSLAAVPRDWPLPGALGARVTRLTGADGLRRFKSSFAPVWEPLYLAAPDRLGLLLGGLDLADRITRPRDGLPQGPG